MPCPAEPLLVPPLGLQEAAEQDCCAGHHLSVQEDGVTLPGFRSMAPEPQLLTYLGVRMPAQDETELGFPTGVKVASLIEPWLELAGPKSLRDADITCRQLLTLNRSR